MPTSCEDLESIGQKINGIFLVKGTNATIDAVFCDFNANNITGKCEWILPVTNLINHDFRFEKKKLDFQKWIGHTEVKSAPVYFYVQRNSPFYAFKDTIPFDADPVNIGNAMDIQTGIFTAPKSGTYFFSFTGLAGFPETKFPDLVHLEIGLYLNGVSVGRAQAEESNTVDNQKCPLSLQSTLNLETGASIWLQIDAKSSSEVFLCSDTTHFTGWMLEEKIFE